MYLDMYRVLSISHDNSIFALLVSILKMQRIIATREKYFSKGNTTQTITDCGHRISFLCLHRDVPLFIGENNSSALHNQEQDMYQR